MLVLSCLIIDLYVHCIIQTLYTVLRNHSNRLLICHKRLNSGYVLWISGQETVVTIAGLSLRVRPIQHQGNTPAQNSRHKALLSRT